ncbi:hypothetical protein EUTSA_v10013648mg [Eutrema salsugineum]|uniref:F-box domain-containing protein n=1 Tax=Eutrema salsugineum TaxID=72664 RepID=V4LET2_EUTSA|nr:hypothetical protein EUTSA_v10013648mg [Eutrema salsugineum]
MDEGFLEFKERRMREQWPELYWRARADMISKLPDSLVCQILLYLPTKEIVRTSVLSKRWKSLWLLIPELSLDANQFPNHNALEHKSCLHKLKLSIRKDVNDPPCVTRWTDFLARRNFSILMLSFESVSLPCLKTMRLEHNVYASDAGLESLISSCTVLEDLSIVRMFKDNIKVLRVHSQTLTSLHVDYLFGGDDDIDDDEFVRKGTGVMVDAPRLKYLKFEDDQSDSKIITNSGSLAKVNVAYVFHEHDAADEVDLPKRNMVRNFFTSISGVREMKISLHTMEFLDLNMEYDPLPLFCNLSHLKVTFSLFNLYLLPALLESFPNLKSLVFMLDYFPSRVEEAVARLSSTPRCLLSSLESVKIKSFSRVPANMEVARYFVENSVVLKKLVLNLRFSMLEDGFYMLRDLLALPRRSRTCQILLC